VQAEAGVPEQPLVDRRGLVRRVVVQDQVQVQVLGDGGVDELEGAQELLVAVAAVVRSPHPGRRAAEPGHMRVQLRTAAPSRTLVALVVRPGCLAGPLGGALVLNVDDTQPQQLHQGIIGREMPAGPDDFPHLPAE